MAQGGYRALEQALSKPREKILEAMEISGLRGRGGAGFPTGRKWRAVAQQDRLRNSSSPMLTKAIAGAYIDRFLMEDDPHALLEGMTARCLRRRREQRLDLSANRISARRRSSARCDCRGARGRLLGPRVLGTRLRLRYRILSSATAATFVAKRRHCFVPSKARRPEVMARPPYPTEHGLFGKPTLINNVETLVNVPWIVAHGGEAYRDLGFSQSRGTKVVSLNSLFLRPGLYEIEFGVTVRHIVEELGGGLRDGANQRRHHRRAAGRHHSAASARHAIWLRRTRSHRCERRSRRRRRIRRDTRRSRSWCITSSPSARTSPAANALHVASAAGGLKKFLVAHQFRSGVGGEFAESRQIMSALKMTSLCGHGTGLGEFAESVLRYYRDGARTMLQVTINGQRHEFPVGLTILTALRRLDVHVPTLCHDDRLKPTGACRLCSVEIVGWNRHVTACNTPLTDGMEIQSHSPGVEEARRTLLQLLGENYPAEAARQFPEKEFHRYLANYDAAPTTEAKLSPNRA